jgi:hypothetical protein
MAEEAGPLVQGRMRLTVFFIQVDCQNRPAFATTGDMRSHALASGQHANTRVLLRGSGKPNRNFSPAFLRAIREYGIPILISRRKNSALTNLPGNKSSHTATMAQTVHRRVQSCYGKAAPQVGAGDRRRLMQRASGICFSAVAGRRHPEHVPSDLTRP